MKTQFTLTVASFLLAVSPAVGQVVTTTTQAVTTLNTATPSPAPQEMTALSTPAMLKLYALSQVASGSVFVWGQSIMSSVGDVRSLHFTGDVDEVIGKLMLDPSSLFKFKVRDTSPLYVYGNLSNSDGDSLFSSYEMNTPMTSSGSFVINPTLRLQMNGIVPVRFKGSQYAKIYYTDPSTGESWVQDLSVFGEKIYFPVQYAGRGILVIGRQYPGTSSSGYDLEVAYNLKDGQLIENKDVNGWVGFAGIENYLYVNDKFMSQTGPLMVTSSMKAPAKNSWEPSSPPTGSIKLETTPVGTSRPFKVVMSFACTPGELGAIEAYIYDPDTVDSEGFVDEFPGTVSITSHVNSSGVTTTVVTTTWTIKNNGLKAGTSKWLWRFESASFNQPKPYRPYYGEGQG